MTIEKIKDFISKKEEGISDIMDISPSELDYLEKLIIKNNGIMVTKNDLVKQDSNDIAYNLRSKMKEENKNLGAVYDYDIRTGSYIIRIVYQK